MKTLLMFNLFFSLSINVLAQINPDEFPKIGYADMYWLKKNCAYGNPGQINYADSSWFYPALHELGLTHVVS